MVIKSVTEGGEAGNLGVQAGMVTETIGDEDISETTYDDAFALMKSMVENLPTTYRLRLLPTTYYYRLPTSTYYYLVRPTTTNYYIRLHTKYDQLLPRTTTTDDYHDYDYDGYYYYY